jgi:hypothetical protein
LGPISAGERELAENVLPFTEPGMLVMFDRGFYRYAFYAQARDTGADLLFRVSSNLKLPVLQRFSDGSHRSAITSKNMPTPTTQGEARWKIAIKNATEVRVIEYQFPNRSSETYRLITTITEWRETFART